MKTMTTFRTPNWFLLLVITLILSGSKAIAQATITYSQNFTSGSTYGAGSPQFDGWTTFCAQLTPRNYTSVTLKGSRDAVGVTLTNATAVTNLASALNLGFSYSSGSWYVGQCGGGYEITNTGGICNCGSGYTVRPKIGAGNPNWGGINSTVCNGPTQTITVVFTYIAPAPTITSFSPTTAAAGATITINGTNFTDATAVSFGGVAAASFSVVNATTITAVVGSGASGSVSVTTPGGTATRVGFTFNNAPTISSFTPTSGCPNVTQVVITGTNFTGATAVAFGVTPAASFTVNSATQITATPASGTTGNIKVTTPSGQVFSAPIFTVNTISTAPTSISGTTTICTGGSTNLSQVGGALGSGGLYKWYSGSCGGTFLSNGASITVSPTTTTTYFVLAQGTCNTTACASVTVTVDSPAAPTGSLAITNSTCASACTVSGGSIGVGTVSGSGGTLEYSIDNGATWSATLPIYNAPQTILASVRSVNNCRSASTNVGSTLAGTCTTPAAPTGSLAITNSSCVSACTVSGGSIMIGSVSGSGGTLQYSTDNGTTWSATLPTYNAPQTIIASVINAGGCRSTSTSVGTTVAGTCTTPDAPTISADGPTTFCSGNNVLLTSSVGTGYLWSTGATSQSISVTSAGSYTVQVSNASGCFSLASSPVAVTVTAQPLWYLDADGDQYYTGAAVPSCTSPGAGYTTALLLGGGDCNDTSADINPGASEICYNNIDDNCDTILSDGCAPVVVNMTPSYNGSTLPSLATAIPAVPYSYAPYTNLKYRFRITNLSTGVTAPDVIQVSRFVTIPASIHSYNAQYTITASAVINEEVVPFAGNTITVNSPTIQLITLNSASCGATLASLTSTLTANPGLNATGYTFRIRLNDANPSPTYAFSQSSTRFVSANSFTGFPLQYATSYKVAVQYTFNDPVTNLPTQSGYGAECTVNTPSIPLTRIVSPTCGSQVATMNAGVTAQAASYATGYQFRIRLFADNGPTPTYYYTAVNPSRFSSLANFQGITLGYNTAYSISVQYSILNGSTTVWSGYGADCKVTTPFFPVTSLVPSQCGLSTATDLNQQLNITPYPGFPHYMVKLDEISGEDVVNSEEREIAYSYFRLSDFAIAQLGKNYNVSVKIKLNGVFGDYDTACDLFTAPLGKTVTVIPFKATAYPNPFANNFMLDVKTASQSSVNLKVYDMVGRLIEQRDVTVSDMQSMTIGERYPAGVYNVVVSQEESVQTVRVVKR